MRVDTSGDQIIDLTGEMRSFCSGRGDGLALATLPHATAALVLMELGSGSETDLLRWLGETLPRDASYQHHHGSRGHGADHLVPALLGAGVTLPVVNGEPQLGTWQRLALVDTNRDNSVRLVRLTFIPG
ncbi:MAG: YjbQ family protein [Candidatus Dormibacteria bacterium]